VWNDRSAIQAADSDIEKVRFATLVNYISHNGSCEKMSEFASGKQQLYLEKKIKKMNKCVSRKVKMRLYEAIILSTLYCAGQTYGL